MSNSGGQPQGGQEGSGGDVHAKLRKLRSYRPFVESIISKLETRSNSSGSEQLQKMRVLQKFILEQDIRSFKKETMDKMLKLLHGIYQKHLPSANSQKSEVGKDRTSRPSDLHNLQHSRKPLCVQPSGSDLTALKSASSATPSSISRESEISASLISNNASRVGEIKKEKKVSDSLKLGKQEAGDSVSPLNCDNQVRSNSSAGGGLDSLVLLSSRQPSTNLSNSPVTIVASLPVPMDIKMEKSGLLNVTNLESCPGGRVAERETFPKNTSSSSHGQEKPSRSESHDRLVSLFGEDHDSLPAATPRRFPRAPHNTGILFDSGQISSSSSRLPGRTSENSTCQKGANLSGVGSAARDPGRRSLLDLPMPPSAHQLKSNDSESQWQAAPTANISENKSHFADYDATSTSDNPFSDLISQAASSSTANPQFYQSRMKLRKMVGLKSKPQPDTIPLPIPLPLPVPSPQADPTLSQLKLPLELSELLKNCARNSKKSVSDILSNPVSSEHTHHSVQEKFSICKTSDERLQEQHTSRHRNPSGSGNFRDEYSSRHRNPSGSVSLREEERTLLHRNPSGSGDLTCEQTSHHKNLSSNVSKNSNWDPPGDFCFSSNFNKATHMPRHQTLFPDTHRKKHSQQTSPGSISRDDHKYRGQDHPSLGLQYSSQQSSCMQSPTSEFGQTSHHDSQASGSLRSDHSFRESNYKQNNSSPSLSATSSLEGRKQLPYASGNNDLGHPLANTSRNPYFHHNIDPTSTLHRHSKVLDTLSQEEGNSQNSPYSPQSIGSFSRNESPSNFSAQDTPVSPEPEEVSCFSPPKDSPVKTIPIEKVTSDVISSRLLCPSPVDIQTSNASYRYEDFVGPAFHSRPPAKKPDLPGTLVIIPQTVPKPAPLTSTLIASAIDASPVKNMVDADSTSYTSGLEVNKTSNTATENICNEDEIYGKSHKCNAIQPKHIPSTKMNKPGQKSQSGSLNIEEYRRRRAMKMNKPSYILDELIPEKPMTSSVPPVSIGRSTPAVSPIHESSPVDMETFGSSAAHSALPVHPHGQPSYTGVNAHSKQSGMDTLLKNRDPRLSEGRRRMHGFSGPSHQQSQNFHQSSRNGPYSHHPSSHYPHTGQGNYSNRMQSSHDPRTASRDPRTLNQQNAAHRFRDPRMPGGANRPSPQPHQQPFLRPPVGYNQASYGMMRTPQPYGPPAGAAFQGMYEVPTNCPQPMSPIPPPASAGTPESAKGISDLIAKSFTCIIMKGLPHFTNSMHIYKFFQDYILSDVCIEVDHGLNCTGTAYIQFPSHESAAECLQRLNGYIMHGFQVTLSAVTSGFFRGAKNTYDSRNFDRERRLGIQLLPPGNCNPFYNPKRAEQRLAAKLAPLVMDDHQKKCNALSLDDVADVPVSGMDDSPQSPDMESTAVVVNNGNKDVILFACKTVARSKDDKSQEGVGGSKTELTAAANKKDRRYRKIVIPSDSESGEDNDDNKETTTHKNEVTIKNKPCEFENIAKSDLDTSVAVTVDATSSRINSTAPTNEFYFPDDNDATSVTDDANISDKDEMFEFEEAEEDGASDHEQSKENAFDELLDITQIDGLPSKKSLGFLPNIRDKEKSKMNTPVKRTKRKGKGDCLASSLLVKMTRKTQVEVEKVLVEENKLRVSIPSPKRLVLSLFNEKSLNTRTKRSQSVSLNVANENSQGSKGLSDDELPDLIDTVSSECDPGNRLEMSTLSDLSDISERDTLVIDLDRSTKEVTEMTFENDTNAFGKLHHIAPKASESKETPVASMINKSPMNEVSSSGKIELLELKRVSEDKSSTPNVPSKVLKPTSAVVMMADSTMSDDEPIILDDTPHGVGIRVESRNRTTNSESVVGSSLSSNDELEIVEVRSGNQDQIKTDVQPPASSESRVSSATEQADVVEKEKFCSVGSDSPVSADEAEVIDLDEDEEEDQGPTSRLARRNNSVIIEDDGDDMSDAQIVSNHDAEEPEHLPTAPSRGDVYNKSSADTTEASSRAVVFSSDISGLDGEKSQPTRNIVDSKDPSDLVDETPKTGGSTGDPIVLDSDSEDEIPKEKQPPKRLLEQGKTSIPPCKKQKLYTTDAVVKEEPSCNFLIESVTSLQTLSSDQNSDYASETEKMDSTSANPELDLAHTTDIFADTSLNDDYLGDLSQIMPSIDDDVLLNNLPDVSTLTSITDPRILDDNVPANPKHPKHVQQTPDKLPEEKPLIDEKKSSSTAEFDDDDDNVDLSEEVHSIVASLNKKTTLSLSLLKQGEATLSQHQEKETAVKAIAESLEKSVEGGDQFLQPTACLDSRVEDAASVRGQPCSGVSLETGSTETETVGPDVSTKSVKTRSSKKLLMEKNEFEEQSLKEKVGGAATQVVSSLSVCVEDEKFSPTGPEMTSTADSDGDDSASVGLASVSSFPDDLSTISGESRELKTPDSSNRRRRKQILNSSSLERRRVTRGSIVEKPDITETVYWDDGGVVDLFQCELCQYVGRQHVSHLVNYHPYREITCEFKKEDVHVVFRDKLGPPQLEQNEVPEKLDLSWVPDGLHFDKALTCIANDCDYISNIRFDLLYHYLEHYPKSLPTLFHCRLCQHMTNDMEVSYDHFTSHTGEYRHKCLKCNFSSYSAAYLDEHHNSNHSEAVKEVTSSDLVLEDKWPYIHICKSCLFTQINLEYVENHVAQKHNGKAEIVRANMFRSITLHTERYKREPPAIGREKGKGKKTTKKNKNLEKKVFIGDETKDEESELGEEAAAKELVDRISNIYTTRTVLDVQQRMSKLEILTKRLELVSTNEKESAEEDDSPEQGNSVQPTVENPTLAASLGQSVESSSKTQRLPPKMMDQKSPVDSEKTILTTENDDVNKMETSSDLNEAVTAPTTSEEAYSIQPKTVPKRNGGGNCRSSESNNEDNDSCDGGGLLIDEDAGSNATGDAVVDDDDSGKEDEEEDGEETVSTVDPFEVSEALMTADHGFGGEDGEQEEFNLVSTILKLSQSLKKSIIAAPDGDSTSDPETEEDSEEEFENTNVSGGGDDEVTTDLEPTLRIKPSHQLMDHAVFREQSKQDSHTASNVENSSIPEATSDPSRPVGDVVFGEQVPGAVDRTNAAVCPSSAGASSTSIPCCPQKGCSFQSSSHDMVVEHEALVHGPFKCSFYFCSYITSSEQLFVVHYQTHPQAINYGCGYQCPVSVTSVEQLITHYKSVHVKTSPSLESVGSPPPEMMLQSSSGSHEGDHSCFLRIESVGTLDPSSAKQMFGEGSPVVPLASSSLPSTHCSTTLFPSSILFSARPSMSSLQHQLAGPLEAATTTHQGDVVSTSGSAAVISSSATAVGSVATSAASTTPVSESGSFAPKNVVIKKEPFEGASEAVEGASDAPPPPGLQHLPRQPPTVPILFLFQQYQSIAAFRVYTGRRAHDVFKCMFRDCIYSSNNPQQFCGHARQHADQFRCCYCLLRFPTAEELVGHVTEEHSHCGYMCKHCLYRSTSTLYLGSHMKNFHPTDQPRYVKVSTINKVAPPNPPVEKFIHAYQCGYEGCARRTVDAEMFRSHVNQTHGPGAVLKCFLCTFTGPVAPLVEHMRVHMMDEFQCPYCLYGESEREKLLTHLVNCHPGRSGKVLLRKQDQHDKSLPVSKPPLQLSGPSLQTTQSSSIAVEVQSPPKQILPLTTEHTQLVPPVVEASQKQSVPMLPEPSKLSLAAALPSNIQPLQQFTKPLSSSLLSVVEHANLLLPTALLTPIPAFSNNTCSKSTLSSTCAPANTHPNTAAIESGVTVAGSDAPQSSEAVTFPMELLTPPKKLPSQDESQSPISLRSPPVTPSTSLLPAVASVDLNQADHQVKALQSSLPLHRISADQAIAITSSTVPSTTASSVTETASPTKGYNMRRTRSFLNSYDQSGGTKEGTYMDDESQGGSGEKAGLMGSALYRCGNQTCAFSSTTLAILREHLQVCDLARDSPTLRCCHCGRQYRHLSTLLEHIKVHGAKRFYCGVPGCTYRATMLHYFRNHMRQLHNTASYRHDAKDPTVKDPENQEFIVTPSKEPTHKKRKNEYEVGDELPHGHVSYIPLRCYHCQFSSKIRLNLIKHLQLHQKYPTGIPERPTGYKYPVREPGELIPIPMQQPVNPVPCLERKELMFDKMMNLAGSTFEDKKKLEEVDLRLKNPIPAEEFDNLPGFVPESALNACGVESCKYISSDEIMLKYHIRSLHSDVSQFPCPHCKNTFITVEKISTHFKLHGDKLYRCGWCPYLSFRRPVVERHTREKHPSKRPFEFVIRDPDDEKLLEDDKKTDIASYATTAVGSGHHHGGPGPLGGEGEPQWQCGLCRFQSVTQQAMVNHTSLKHDIKSQYKCGHCNVKSSVMTSFDAHFAAKHPNQSFKVLCMYYRLDAEDIEPLNKGEGIDGKHEPLWRRHDPHRLRQIRGIMLDEAAAATPSSVKTKAQVPLGDLQPGLPDGENFVCPKCLSFRNPCVNTFRSHLCKEADYHRYECSECGVTSPLLPSLRRHYNKMHHAQFLNDCYLLLPIDEEKEVWVESIITHQNHHIRLYKESESPALEDGGSRDSGPDGGRTEHQPAGNSSTRVMSPPRTGQGTRLTRRSSQGSVSGEDASSTLPALETSASSSCGGGVGVHLCDVCGLTCKSSGGLYNHVRASHAPKYQCGHCPYVFGSKFLVEVHCKQQHSRKPVIIHHIESVDLTQDTTTAEESDSADNSKDHLLPELETPNSLKTPPHTASRNKVKHPRKCPDCPFMTTSNALFYRHCKSHVSQRPYLCEECNTRYRDIKTAKQHSRQAHGKICSISYMPLDQTPPKSSASAASEARHSDQDTSFAHPSPVKAMCSDKRIVDNPAPSKPTKFVIDEEFDELPDLEAQDITPNLSIKVEKKDSIDREEKESKPTVCKKNVTLEENQDLPEIEYICCHCGHRGDGVAIGEHMRSQHKDMPFIVRKKKGDALALEIYHYKCIYCSNGSDSLMEAMNHWVKLHVTLDFKFVTSLYSSQNIPSDPSQELKPNIALVKSETGSDETSSTYSSVSSMRGPRRVDETSSASATTARPNKRASRSSNPVHGEPVGVSIPTRQPPRKRPRATSDAESSSTSFSLLNTSVSEDDLESESEIASDLETTVDSISVEEEKVYRCSSCRRTSKIREEIEAHLLEKHGGSRWCSVIELPASARIRSQRRLVKCRVCSYMGFSQQVTQHGTTAHPDQPQPFVMPLLVTDKETFRCDICLYKSKSRKNIQRHMSACHSGQTSCFSRFANGDNADFEQQPLETASLVDLSICRTEGNSRQLDSDGKYRCHYCDDMADSFQLIKEHHDFLHSHLPFVIADSDASAISGKGQLQGSSPATTSVSLARHMHGAVRAATARKSFSFAPGSCFLRRKRKISRGYACKSGRARVSTSDGDGDGDGDLGNFSDEPQRSTTKKLHMESDFTDTTFEDDEAREECAEGPWSCYGMPRTRVSLEGLSTTVDMGSGTPVKISAVHLSRLFDLNPKVVLADIALALDND